MTPRPLWRWWLFCAALWVSWEAEWDWAGKLMSWCVLPEWVASPEELLAAREAAEDAPW